MATLPNAYRMAPSLEDSLSEMMEFVSPENVQRIKELKIINELGAVGRKILSPCGCGAEAYNDNGVCVYCGGF
jgi:hypothetical protein